MMFSFAAIILRLVIYTHAYSGENEVHDMLMNDEFFYEKRELSGPYQAPVDAKKLLQAHNIARSLHKKTNPLTWDATLQRHAEEYAMKLARMNGQNKPLYFEHDSKELEKYDEGENLLYDLKETQWGIKDYTSCMSPVLWYNEITEFDWNKLNQNYNVFPIPTHLGHFTAMVWRRTTKVGCGAAYNNIIDRWGGPNHQLFVVCRYQEPGNVLFEFPENVYRTKNKQLSGLPEILDTLCPWKNRKNKCKDKSGPDFCQGFKQDCNADYDFASVIRDWCAKTCKLC